MEYFKALLVQFVFVANIGVDYEHVIFYTSIQAKNRCVNLNKIGIVLFALRLDTHQ